MDAPIEKPPKPWTNIESAPAEIELPPSGVRIVVLLLLALTLLLPPLGIVFLYYQSGALIVLVKDHAHAMVGIPWSGGAAFIMVMVWRTSFGLTFPHS